MMDTGKLFEDSLSLHSLVSNGALDMSAYKSMKGNEQGSAIGKTIGSFARGVAEGDVGLPGDIESLGRALFNFVGLNVSDKTALPTTEDIQAFVSKFIGPAADPAAQTAGQFVAPGVTPAKAISVTAKSASAMRKGDVIATHTSPYIFDEPKLGINTNADKYGNPQGYGFHFNVGNTKGAPTYGEHSYDVTLPKGFMDNAIYLDKPINEQPKSVLEKLSSAGLISDVNDARNAREVFNSIGDGKAASEHLKSIGIDGAIYDLNSVQGFKGKPSKYVSGVIFDPTGVKVSRNVAAAGLAYDARKDRVNGK